MKLQIIIIFLVSISSIGCVEREMVIFSDPPEAQVWLDGKTVGNTPVTVPFSFYGKREISLYRPGYEIYTIVQEVKTPWYQYFPIDFFTEFMIPLNYKDQQVFSYTLKPHLSQSSENKDKLQNRGQEFQKKLQK